MKSNYANMVLEQKMGLFLSQEKNSFFALLI